MQLFLFVSSVLVLIKHPKGKVCSVLFVSIKSLGLKYARFKGMLLKMYLVLKIGNVILRLILQLQCLL